MKQTKCTIYTVTRTHTYIHTHTGGRRGLIPTLESTHMHFVRCVKPNDAKKPLMFDRPKVAGQLSSNGVVEAVKLAQAGGLPTRYVHF